MFTLMKDWIVLEGGGTTTNGVRISGSGDILGFAKEKGSNPFYIEPEKAAKRILRIIDNLIANAEPIQGIYSFVPNIRKLSGVIEPKLPLCTIQYFGDTMPALYAAFGEEPGIAVLSGTGSFACGRNLDGKIFTIGGYGPLFSDYGSGYDIGRRVLAKAVSLYDTGHETILTSAVLKKFKIDSIAALGKLQIDKNLFDRENVAAFSRIAADCAKLGDLDAQEILADAALELARLGAQCAERMGNIQDLRCSLIGGISNIGKWLIEPFIAHLQNEAHNLTYTEARYVPIVGACIYMQQQNGYVMTGEKIMEQLKAYL